MYFFNYFSRFIALDNSVSRPSIERNPMIDFPLACDQDKKFANIVTQARLLEAVRNDIIYFSSSKV
jgi:hypothetical protein